MIGDKVQILVSSEIPLVFVIEEYKTEVEPLAKDWVTIGVSDFDVPMIEDSRDDLEALFSRELFDDESYGHMSVSDLWWITVT